MRPEGADRRGRLPQQWAWLGVTVAALAAPCATTAAPSSPLVHVVLRPAEGAACSLHDTAGRPTSDRLRPVAGGFLWERRDGDVLSCDGPGLEPLDLAPDTVPSELTVELRPARLVRLETDWSGAEALVEWRALAAGGGTALIARRRLAIAEQLVLPVAHEARFLRFHSEGQSPVSVLAGTQGDTLRLPRPVRGGEILGLLPSRGIAPHAMDLVAPTRRVEVAVDGGRVFAARGLAPGRYSLIPRYRGGFSGRPLPVVVRAGETTELIPLSLDERGAAALRTAPEVCDGKHVPVRLLVRRAGARGEGEPAGTPVLERRIDDPSCDHDLEGLEGGLYEATLSSLGPSGAPGEPLAAGRFEVAAGRWTPVVLAAPVFASGRVTSGSGRREAGVTLRFQTDTGVWATRANDEGEYALRLGAPGQYAISVQAADGAPAARFERRLESGAQPQPQDFDLSETALHVRVVSQDGTLPDETVELAVTRGGQRWTSTFEAGSEAVPFVDLDFGEYVVTASASSGLASSDPVAVRLTPERPVAEVDVVLDRHKGSLEVVDENGGPVPSVQVRAGTAVLRPVAPGLYRLDDVAVGERLHLRADGFVPMCRVLSPQELPDLRLVLTRASEVVTLHLAANRTWESGLLVDLPGSDCPVELGEAEALKQLEPGRTTLVLRFPPGAWRLLLGSETYTLVAPGSDVEVSAEGDAVPADVDKAGSQP